ncbi:hypothetical protein Bbelb_149840 [Branchiostoma belcheri]|nr:hypothetical protein Bbelb_149840 [Branchiostoma belcheri]
MKLFSEVRESCGQPTVKRIRDLESQTKIIARHRNHLVFNLRCKDENITPPSIRLKTAIRTKNAKDIIQKAERALLRERIRLINNKISHVKEKQQKISEELQAELPENLQEAVRLHVIRSGEREFQVTRDRHLEKLERLQQTKTRQQQELEVDLSGTQLKKWVVNISEKTLNEHQTRVLQKGLNFAVTPDKIPSEDFVVATESACMCLPLNSAEQLRSEVAGILRTVKPPKSNITKQERDALKELRKEKDLLILPADKGKATVVMDRTDYEKKVSDMLADDKTYEKLSMDPTQRYKRKLVAILKRLKANNKITDEQYKHLYPTAENVPRMYCTPKIHKPGHPLRPIVDYTGSIGYNTSRALADLLAPLVGQSTHHIKNSKHLAEEMSSILLEEDEIFLSHDVVSLFTNTPIPETLNIIKNRLQEDKDLKSRTNLEIEDIIELLSFIVTTTYFSFRGNIYQQKFGTAMGSPVSPVLANLFMEWLERQAIATAPINCRPKLWKRYVDDIMEIVKKGVQQELTDHLNNTDPTGSIQFTHEEEKDGTLPFLDTLMVRKEDGTVKLLVYRKSTHTDQYLNFQSHHPLHQKLGVIRTLLDRCNAVVTEDADKALETEHVKKALTRCGYPPWTFKKVEQRSKQPKRKDKSNKQEDKTRAMVIIPMSKESQSPLKELKPKTTLRSLLVHPKDKLQDTAKTDCIYKIPCKSCSEVYIGETGRTFGTRLEEHKKEADNMDTVKYTRSQKRHAQKEEKKSAVTDHIARNNCVIDWEGAKVIDREDNRRTRWIKEAVWIRKSTPVMNRDEGGYKLSHVWDSVLAAKAPPTSATYSGEMQYSSQKL